MGSTTRRSKYLPGLALIALSLLSAITVAQEADDTLELIRDWVAGSYDNTAQAEADAAANVPDELRHRVMYQMFVPVAIPQIPGHLVFQQSSVDGSTDPDLITRLGVLQFFEDEETGTIRQRELNFKDPARFHNAHLDQEQLQTLTLDDFDWNAGCDFFLSTDDSGQRVSGPLPDGACRVFNPGTNSEMIAEDEVVITPEQYWFLGRFVDATGRVMWGNASGEHVKMDRVATLDEIVNPAANGGVLIFGATRNTGLETAKLLIARGDTVTAFVRPSSDRSELEKLGVRFVEGDALNADDVNAAFEAARYSAVVTTLGCFRCETPPDYIGNRNVFDAALDHGVDRVIMVSTLGTGKTADSIPWIVKWVLSEVIVLKDQAEKHLMDSGLAYTIIRPGGLKSADEATGRGLLTPDHDAMGIITRQDLARLIVQALDDPAASKQEFSAIDPEFSWPWDMF